jgi:hypothetical protein
VLNLNVGTACQKLCYSYYYLVHYSYPFYGSLISTKMFPLSPRDSLNSESKYVVSNAPLAFAGALIFSAPISNCLNCTFTSDALQ